MRPRFVDSDSCLPADAPREGLVHSQMGRVLVVAIVIAFAASAAARACLTQSKLQGFSGDVPQPVERVS